VPRLPEPSTALDGTRECAGGGSQTGRMMFRSELWTAGRLWSSMHRTLEHVQEDADAGTGDADSHVAGEHMGDTTPGVAELGHWPVTVSVAATFTR
jgi:hypothetical protein